jgi:hypothetical protein
VRPLVRWGAVLLLVMGALFLTDRPAHAQELDCSVNLDYSQLSGSNFQFLDDLERRVREYMNSHSWTDDRFLEHERINCSLQIIMTEAISRSDFRARLIVATRRPIYNTMQQTPIVRINDENWRFSYTQGTPLELDLDRFDPLTSVLDFYAYVMLGYDYDTFSELGGQPYFQQARRISDRAQSTGGAGWSSVSSDRTRSALISELLDPRFEVLRRTYYRYHMQGLDRFIEQTQPARQTVLESIRTLQSLAETVSRSYTLDLFFSAKYQELTGMFRNTTSGSRAYNLLTQVDPAHSSTYNELVN